MFQSTHPRGVRPSASSRYCLSLVFQSTHPRGVRQIYPHATSANIKFQSTHPRGVRLYSAYCQSVTRRFNPRTRVGCDNRHSTNKPIKSVSIHAPAWGATIYQATRQCAIVVSIHAPAWGATRNPPHTHSISRCFNPRTRVGCDRGLSAPSGYPYCFNPRTRVGCDQVARTQAQDTLCVSIHAPAWGATLGTADDAAYEGFNPRTRVGCDGMCFYVFRQRFLHYSFC